MCSLNGAKMYNSSSKKKGEAKKEAVSKIETACQKSMDLRDDIIA